MAVLCSSMLVLSSAAFADGMPIHEGRFTGGPTTVLTLTPVQAATLRKAEERREQKFLILSEAQRMCLMRSAGAAPAKLVIYDTRTGENDCTCEAVNRGLWYEEGSVEVPHTYLAAEAVPTSGGGSIPIVMVVVLSVVLAAAGGLAVILRAIARR
jgi:hypothetical protein